MYYVQLLLYKFRHYWWITAAVVLAALLLCLVIRRRRRYAVRKRLLAAGAVLVLLLGTVPVLFTPFPRRWAQPVSVTLRDDLLQHTYAVCADYGVPVDVMLAIMYHESRFVDDIADNVNKNGTRDRGLCQINEINWEWLAADHSIDVSEPGGNIQASALILSRYLKKYPLEQALAAYAAGPSGMKRGRGLRFASEILGILDALPAEYSVAFV